eukprot:6198518-Pleurochrysis_carterae.AAC.1
MSYSSASLYSGVTILGGQSPARMYKPRTRNFVLSAGCTCTCSHAHAHACARARPRRGRSRLDAEEADAELDAALDHAEEQVKRKDAVRDSAEQREKVVELLRTRGRAAAASVRGCGETRRGGDEDARQLR